MKDSREKQLRVLSGIEFSIVLQSMTIVSVTIRSVWVDLWNYYEMRDLV